MRDAIRSQLLQVCANVFQPFIPTKDTDKPFIVVRMGVELPDSMKYAYKQMAMIYPYVDRGNYNNLTALIGDIITVFSEPFIYQTKTVQLFYEGKLGQEYNDPEWEALTQALEFSYITIHERK